YERAKTIHCNGSSISGARARRTQAFAREQVAAYQPPAPPRAEASHVHPSWSSHFSNPRNEPPLNPLAHTLRSNARTASKNHRSRKPAPRKLYSNFVRTLLTVNRVSRPRRGSAFHPFSECLLHRRYETTIHLLELLASPEAIAALFVKIKNGRNEQHARRMKPR